MFTAHDSVTAFSFFRKFWVAKINSLWALNIKMRRKKRQRYQVFYVQGFGSATLLAAMTITGQGKVVVGFRGALPPATMAQAFGLNLIHGECRT
jgi:hypothetical protein